MRKAQARAPELAWARKTLGLQAPRLAPYVEAMRARLADALEVAAELINVKVSSLEAMDALGRGEGIAASAVVLLEAP